MISVIDMPPPGESTWWRGKHGFAVGFFPAECVAVIGDKVPRHLTVSTTVRSRLPVKPVLRKHGKLIAFFRSFILNRPSRRRLKQSGILRERVFGCDLGEHLLNSGQDGKFYSIALNNLYLLSINCTKKKKYYSFCSAYRFDVLCGIHRKTWSSRRYIPP